MTRILEDALQEARALPDRQQERLGQFIKRLVHDPEAVNGDAYWEMLLADPRSDEMLERLAQEAGEHAARGDVVDLEDVLSSEEPD